MTATIQLKKRREKPVNQRHPWIFSGAIQEVRENPENGDIVFVQDANGTNLAKAYYNANSQIIGRILTWDVEEEIDEAFWRRRIRASAERRNLLQINSDAYRIVNAEADNLPGLVVEKYGDWLVIQCLTMGIDVQKETILSALEAEFSPKGIIERSDVDVRRKEGLRLTKGLVAGIEPPSPLIITENGIQFEVSLLDGQKTGFYLDQRTNRELVCQPRFVEGKEVLNVFSYTGGFGVYALKNGASHVLNTDSSVPALEVADRNTALNQFSEDQAEFLAADAFELLRDYRDEGRKFDLIILDPPKFVKSQRNIDRACRGYKDINLLAMSLLRENGVLATFSCSGLLSADLFQKVIFGAGVDAKKDIHVIERLSQSADHPILLSAPESFYLKGLLLRVSSS